MKPKTSIAREICVKLWKFVLKLFDKVLFSIDAKSYDKSFYCMDVNLNSVDMCTCVIK